MVGTFAAQHAYLSNDRGAIYTEFKVAIEQSLKGTKDFPLQSGATIDIERQGGSVKFSSDTVISRGVANKTLLCFRKRYLLFLEHRAEVKEFSIIAAYRLASALARQFHGINST